tara:strand:- start:70 stop:480 length:411 start_codon:yes stop_codon:yes gene_type:complete
MGLDMYLTGDRFTPTHDRQHERGIIDGYEVESQRLSLGQWRKHWALHNYIEEHHNPDGQHRFDLDSDALRQIADAVVANDLVDPDDGGDMPHYQDVYAYHKEIEQVAKTVKALRNAADWLELEDGFWRSVEYYGSW